MTNVRDPSLNLPDATAMAPDAALDELALYLRPPGQGVHTISTGKAAALEATARYLSAPRPLDAPGTFAPRRPAWTPSTTWHAYLAEALLAPRPPLETAILGIPSDTGAGIARGAMAGPMGIRDALRDAPTLDLGDVFCVPQLLEDEMLSLPQRERTQDALYPQVPLPHRRRLPVAPISVASRAYRLLRALHPGLRLVVLGGDHTVAWPAVDAVLGATAADNEHTAIVHFDAHTDLLESRLGVRTCFATWAYHANARLGRGGRLVQIGLRASARTKETWESELGVQQIWADEAHTLGAEGLAHRVVEQLRSTGAKRVYVSNDLDGTDQRWARACGTPEPGGLTPAMVLAVLDGLFEAGFEIAGADVVELAPGLGLDPAAAALSCRLAADYVLASIALLNRHIRPSEAAHLVFPRE